MSNYVMTRHAIKRARQRLGIPKRAAEREMARALEGMKIEDCTGKLRKYLDYLRTLHGASAHYRVTPTAVFAFHGVHLVTVLPMIPTHRRSALAQWKKHKAS